FHAPIFVLKGGCQPALDVEQNPLAVRVMPQGLQDEGVREIIERSLDVELHYPVIPPTALPRDGQGLVGRLPRPIPVGVLMKVWLHAGLQVPFRYRLGDAVRDGGHAELSLASVLLGDRHHLDWWREVAARGQPVPELVEVILEVALKFLY